MHRNFVVKNNPEYFLTHNSYFIWNWETALDIIHWQQLSLYCYSGRIKLENGFSACSGRVEISYNRWGHDEWGTVCDNNWDLTDAAVVCREMGCGDAIEAKSAAYFGHGGGIVRLDDVSCIGNELTLTSCESNRIESFHLHSKDAGVICQCKLLHVRILKINIIF